MENVKDHIKKANEALEECIKRGVGGPKTIEIGNLHALIAIATSLESIAEAKKI